ncbi:MAG: hypothetical protein A2Y79_00190 [Deltaproteobacteria bacterium RBG_13_43_22]|nr:MAG: hypothetical protein A2Y79_00190 [Deltaproteobacteria bacterium RBG_13_43_22]
MPSERGTKKSEVQNPKYKGNPNIEYSKRFEFSILVIRIRFGFVPYGHSHPDCLGTGSRFRASDFDESLLSISPSGLRPNPAPLGRIFTGNS